MGGHGRPGPPGQGRYGQRNGAAARIRCPARPGLGAVARPGAAGRSRVSVTCCPPRLTTSGWSRWSCWKATTPSPTGTPTPTATVRRSQPSCPRRDDHACFPSWAARTRPSAGTPASTARGAPLAHAAPAHCVSCGFFVPLSGELGRLFGACANAYAPDDGRVVSADHGCGAHSEAMASGGRRPGGGAGHRRVRLRPRRPARGFGGRDRLRAAVPRGGLIRPGGLSGLAASARRGGRGGPVPWLPPPLSSSA